MQDGIKRINVCFPKDDITTLPTLDQIRGNQSRSQALYNLVTYALTWNPETLKGILKDRHKLEAVQNAY